ncbi:MAG TPA: cobalamin B12-binding domain-containing protein [Candidatus Poseidoniales archaeon]|jgi:methylmalonyl-CoA mutase C-terminal domain/subunit|nr:MAG: methylmalonyl-CoA mutase [Euryarchaeota archaeon]HIG33367.1 cobalamin B12-binding domain-containing protein [Candidatus Poseidoniales archaeon]HIL67067.1 cobalamin B12-binding domain-containing protein [Candidatus Poseidoniales archaeon]
MRVVIAKPGLDGHDRGAKVIARALRDGGHDVIYTGLRKTPSDIVRIVNDEDAEVLGLSTLSGAHDSLIPKICNHLREAGLGNVIVFAGGIIPERDLELLYKSGVRAVFGPGTPTSDVLDFLEEALLRKQNKHPIGVGDDLGWHWN